MGSPPLTLNKSREKPDTFSVVSKLRAECDDLTEEERKQHRVALGLTREEADSLFEKLKGTELFWYDEDGETRWKWA